jgi:hypothetical protein
MKIFSDALAAPKPLGDIHAVRTRYSGDRSGAVVDAKGFDRHNRP